MKYVHEVEYSWTVNCPDCGTGYDEYDEEIDDTGTNPVITCGCGCVFEVSCIEC